MIDHNNLPDFPCTECGICCKNINLIPELSQYDLGNGTCQYLGIDLRCTAFELRPYICQSKAIYIKQYHDKIAYKDFMYLSAKVCTTLQKAWGIDEKYRVVLN
jgi:uncharacterized protein